MGGWLAVTARASMRQSERVRGQGKPTRWDTTPITLPRAVGGVATAGDRPSNKVRSATGAVIRHRAVRWRSGAGAPDAHTFRIALLPGGGRLRAVNPASIRLLALSVGLAAAGSALASNEVAALCLFPILGVGALVHLASGLVWLLLPFCLGGGMLLGIWCGRITRRSMPYPLLFGVLTLGLIYAMVVAAGGFGVPDDPKTMVKVGRCVMRAGDVHPAEQVLWLPVAALLGLLTGVVLAAARDATASPLSTAAPPVRDPATPGSPGTPPVRLVTRPATTPPPAPTPALTLGLRPLARIPTQPVDADTRARIAAAVARSTGVAPPPAVPATPPPLPWQREGAHAGTPEAGPDAANAHPDVSDPSS